MYLHIDKFHKCFNLSDCWMYTYLFQSFEYWSYCSVRSVTINLLSKLKCMSLCIVLICNMYLPCSNCGHTSYTMLMTKGKCTVCHYANRMKLKFTPHTDIYKVLQLIYTNYRHVLSFTINLNYIQTWQVTCSLKCFHEFQIQHPKQWTMVLLWTYDATL